ncbi:hypothetical protein [Neptunomonas sp.]|uniref:hypothetical protein n=1 Tax=Neptunomonas sp. TaxID=1971898 RepID=UPI00356792D4
MTYQINAWLERSDPYIKVIHKARKIPVIQWNGDQVEEMIASGFLCPADFSDSGKNEQELIKELFLLSFLTEDNAI